MSALAENRKKDMQSENFHQSSHPRFRPDHRRQVRLYELEKVISHLPKGSRVLEVGAGAGWQSKKLAEQGFDVVAIEIVSSNYNTLREWDIVTYDGSTIPLPNQSVDAVFSSNVLEHIPHIEAFQKEMQRVLKPGGLSIHVMPTSTWRTWTTVGFYVHRLLQVAQGVKKSRPVPSKDALETSQVRPSVRSGWGCRLRRALVPPMHGVRGNFLTEAWYFSGAFWQELFRKTDWKIEKVYGNSLLYSGFRIFGPKLSFSARGALSRIFGSSCKIYVLRKNKLPDD